MDVVTSLMNHTIAVTGIYHSCVSYLLLVCPLRSKENLKRRAEYAEQRLRAKNAPLIYLTLLHISYDERRAHPGSPLAASLPGLVEFRQPSEMLAGVA